jgi:hypothetical protein
VKVGITGTREGITGGQLAELGRLLEELDPEELRHGDCIGADCAAQLVAVSFGIPVVIHPPETSEHRAFCRGARILPEKPSLERARDIVDSVDVMIALPGDHTDVVPSEMWETVEYARQQRRPLYIVLPDGSVRDENQDY